jgi:hypothetical protein
MAPVLLCTDVMCDIPLCVSIWQKFNCKTRDAVFQQNLLCQAVLWLLSSLCTVCWLSMVATKAVCKVTFPVLLLFWQLLQPNCCVIWGANRCPAECVMLCLVSVVIMLMFWRISLFTCMKHHFVAILSTTQWATSISTAADTSRMLWYAGWQ